jgi:hypothetical protein
MNRHILADRLILRPSAQRSIFPRSLFLAPGGNAAGRASSLDAFTFVHSASEGSCPSTYLPLLVLFSRPVEIAIDSAAVIFFLSVNLKYRNCSSSFILARDRGTPSANKC